MLKRTLTAIFFALALCGSCYAAFTIFSLRAITIVSKNLVTDYSATCNGSSNAADKTALDSYKAFAITQPTARNVLTIPAGKHCCFGTVAEPFSGIKDLIIEGSGSTISRCGSAGTWPMLAAKAGTLAQNSTTNALVQTVSAGSLSVTLVTASQNSRFSVGQWVLIAGLDLQGNSGYPPNPGFFEYVQIASIDASGGIITFFSPLVYAYKSTWPAYYDASNTWQGGPATLFSLHADFDTSVTFHNITFENTANTTQFYAQGRNVTFQDVTMTGTTCVSPTLNKTLTFINATMTSCGMEVDKLVDHSIWSNVNIYQFIIQSSAGSNLMEMTGVTASLLTGTPKVFSGSNVIVTSLITLGSTAFGASDNFTCTNCTLAAVDIAGATSVGTDITTEYAISGGVMSKIINNTTATNATTAAGNSVLHFASVPSGMTIGLFINDSTSASSIPTSPPTTVTAFDATTITMSAAATGAGVGNGDSILFRSDPVQWAVPSRNIYFGNGTNNLPYGPVYQVSDVTTDTVGASQFVRVHTTLPSGFPTFTTGLLAKAHPAPRFTCTGCDGSVDARDLAQTPAGDPIYSYSKRTFTGNLASINQKIWGAWNFMKIDVTTAFTGAAAMTWIPGQFGIHYIDVAGAGQFGSIGTTVNAKIANTALAPRTVNQASTSGALSGDTLTAPGSIWLANSINGFLSNDASANSETMTVEIKASQGVVNP